MKKLTVLLFSAIMLFVFAIGASAATSGYTVDTENSPTNIKWSLSDDFVLTFEIDASSANKASTVITNIDPVTLEKSAWNKGLASYSGAKTIIIGDGITEIIGTFAKSTAVTIEIPESLVSIGKNTFSSASALETVYIRGNEPEAGVIDLSKVTSLANNVFLSNKKFSTVKLNPDYEGTLPSEIFKNTGISSLEIPAGVTSLKNKSLSKTASLYTLTILGEETFFESVDVFLDNEVFPRIRAKAGSKAEEFAKENGFTFIDLDTGIETPGTRSEPVPKPEDKAFDPTGSTAHGLISGQYYDTYWAFYTETKTLKFISNTSTKWNETGSFSRGITDEAWKPYADQIEHVEIGPYINKISQGALENLTSLKDVKLGPDITQIDKAAFNGCSSLTSIWRSDKEPIEGRADLSKVKIVNSIFDGTAITEVLLSKDTVNIEAALSFGIKTLLTPNITEELKEYCKINGYNLKNSTNSEELYEYWFYVPTDLPFCGARAVWEFNEATGTLTVHGSGAIDDIVNYYGGGSKTAPWFSVKQQIKHIVITERITAIGKYNFAQCKNLETVQIPDVDGFIIANAAFEKCPNLKSIYRAGTEPIEGTADLSKIHSLESFTFETNYLLANVVISDKVSEIGESVFEGDVNLVNVYGIPGSYAQTWAEANGKSFFDISASAPQPIKCTIPESVSDAETTDAPTDSETYVDTDIMTDLIDTEEATAPAFIFDIGGDDSTTDTDKAAITDAAADTTENKTSLSVLPVVIAAVVMITAVIAVIMIVITKAKKKG
ncbi:MAG: leucine-rich repeat protein [Clostridia bacterium]|nr:leucine-rich repeat protein [Clostridia bacterium]